MPTSERGDELIQRYLDGLSSTAELVELESLLSTEPAVADAFAEATKLQACLKAHFQKQYQIDRIARLLEESTDAATECGACPEGPTNDSLIPQGPAAAVIAPATIFVRQRGVPLEARHTRAREPILRLPKISGRMKWIAAVMLLLAVGAVIWHSTPRSGADQPHVVSGRVVILDRDVATIPDAALFDVAGREPAVIELPEGTRIELTAETQARLGHNVQQTVLQLVTGGGQFDVPSNGSVLQIETPLGKVATTGGRFSVILTTPVLFSTTEPIPMPQLAIIVASGSVTIERNGVTTTLSAGDERVYF